VRGTRDRAGRGWSRGGRAGCELGFLGVGGRGKGGAGSGVWGVSMRSKVSSCPPPPLLFCSKCTPAAGSFSLPLFAPETSYTPEKPAHLVGTKCRSIACPSVIRNPTATASQTLSTACHTRAISTGIRVLPPQRTDRRSPRPPQRPPPPTRSGSSARGPLWDRSQSSCRLDWISSSPEAGISSREEVDVDIINI
jgi:hypothetical protein